MKNNISVLLVAISCLLASCTKETVEPSVYFKCKIDGKAYEISGPGAYMVVLNSTVHQVCGTEKEDGKTISPRTMYLNIESDKTEGTHAIKGKTLGSFEDTDKLLYNTNFNNTLPEKGSLVITERTTESIKGSFSFTAFTFTSPIKKITVTDGEFYVKLR